MKTDLLRASDRVENSQIGNWSVLLQEEALSLSILANVEDQSARLADSVQQGIIHFYFCLEGPVVFAFGPHYSRELQRQKTYFFYNPDATLPFELIVPPGGRLVSLAITLKKLHELFTHDPLPVLNPENSSKKFYDEREISSPLLVTLSQLFSQQLSANVQRIYYEGKVLEIIGLYFSTKQPNTESCPFLNDQETVRKIKHAKEFLLSNLEAPPTLKELAKQAGLNEYQLKVGFKEIYGNTVYGYLLDHKLDFARVKLDSGRFQVNEVAYQIGYTNPSHFIAAFKKKFGITPKKYLMSRRG
ncbi:MAG: helix-turn-helix transcriptional regulator [Cyclobacteriaceae bacterium]|jgi:AraC-like DNA-binding protein|nr:AraC family transcriptional regulator [Flammeovirgaceae bacterium]